MFALSSCIDAVACDYNTISQYYPKLPITIYIDSFSLVSNLYSSNPNVTEKRLLLELNHIREVILMYDMKIEHCEGCSNAADPLTKDSKFSSALKEILATNKFDPKKKYDLTDVFLTTHDSLESFEERILTVYN
jgi:hypothetical protein